MMTKAQLSAIKAGDYVWIGSRGNPRRFLNLAEKITPNQIVLAVLPGYLVRYDRSNGYGYRLGVRNSEYITGVATPEEVAAWNLKEANEEAERTAQEEREAKAEAIRNELSALFPGTIHVHKESTGDKYNGFSSCFSIHNLTEWQVRQIALELAERKEG